VAALLAVFGGRWGWGGVCVCVVNLGIGVGGLSGSAVLLLFSDSFAAGGWRIAMLLSAVIVLPALLARYKVADSPLFERVKAREQIVRMPSIAVFRSHSVPIVLLALVFAFQQMDGVVSGPYIISFMNSAGIPLT